MMYHVIYALGLVLLMSADVTAAKPDLCQLPAVTGFCRASFPSFFFNAATGQCERFTYGGCGGNDNRFDTLSACQDTCSDDTSQSDLLLSDNEDCNLPKDSGLCLAYFRFFFYNTQTGSCERFIYGGCGGNNNRFQTREECQQKCKSEESDLNPVCLKRKKTGKCRAYFRRWYFNANTMSCQRFVYGGCGSNGNNFKSRLECELRCDPRGNATVRKN